MADYIQSHSGGVSPICNDLRAAGGHGLNTSWYQFQLPGKPIGVKVHIRNNQWPKEITADPTVRAKFKAAVSAKKAAPSGATPKASDVLGLDNGATWTPVLFGGNAEVNGPIIDAANILEVAAGTKIKNPDGSFTDVPRDQWFTNTMASEVVSDVIPITTTLLPDGTSRVLLCVEQTSTTGTFINYMTGGYPDKTNTAPQLYSLVNRAWTDQDSYWLDYFVGSQSGVGGVTDPVAHKLPASMAAANFTIKADTMGSAMGAWLEPVYETTQKVRSFLSTGDSTHSGADAIDKFDGWIGRGVRSFMDKLTDTVITYQHAGGSGHSFNEYLNIFDDMYAHSDYSDIILQGFSQNGFDGTDAGAQHEIDEITKRVNKCVAKKQRVYLTTGYGVPGYTTVQNTSRVKVVNAMKALAAANPDYVYVVDTDALITDYTNAANPVKAEYTVKNAEDIYKPNDNIHANLAGQRVMIKALQTAIAPTLGLAPPVDPPTAITLSGSKVVKTGQHYTMSVAGNADSTFHVSTAFTPSTASQDVTWTVQSGDGVTVSATGEVVIVKSGTTVIKAASTVAPSVSETITVTSTVTDFLYVTTWEGSTVTNANVITEAGHVKNHGVTATASADSLVIEQPNAINTYIIPSAADYIPVTGGHASLSFPVTFDKKDGDVQRFGFGFIGTGGAGVTVNYREGANPIWVTEELTFTPSTTTDASAIITTTAIAALPVSNGPTFALGRKYIVRMDFENVTGSNVVKVSAWIDGTLIVSGQYTKTNQATGYTHGLTPVFRLVGYQVHIGVPSIVRKGSTISITAKTGLPDAHKGDVITFSKMFDTLGITAAERATLLDFKVSHPSDGTLNAAGDLTISNTAAGTVGVTITAKDGVYVYGLPVTASFVVAASPVVPPVNGGGSYEDYTVYNRPNKTALAEKFWASKHVCNHTKAIIAFAFDMKNANDSLRRYGYTRGWRTKALYHYGKYVNKPDMAGIPFTELSTPWYNEMGFVAGITIDSVLAGNIAP